MKNILLILTLSLMAMNTKAQNDIDVLLAAGVEDANRFANDYLAPGTNGLMYSMNANWFNTANVKPLGGFEVSVILNAATVKNENKVFNLNAADYNNLQFVDGSSSKMVSTVLGENNPAVLVDIQYEDPIFGSLSQRVQLPNGIGSEKINLLPSAFIQGALGLGKGIEVKARFVPKIEAEDVSLSMYGAGLQLELTEWLPADKLLPVDISGLIAYTHSNADYDLMSSSGVDGENQHLESKINTWLFQLLASTKFPVINLYGGVGFIKGKSESDLLGTYRLTSGGIISQDIVDPFSLTSEVSAVRGTVGAKLKLGFFRLNTEYHISEFNAFSVGVNFGFR